MAGRRWGEHSWARPEAEGGRVLLLAPCLPSRPVGRRSCLHSFTGRGPRCRLLDALLRDYTAWLRCLLWNRCGWNHGSGSTHVGCGSLSGSRPRLLATYPPKSRGDSKAPVLRISTYGFGGKRAFRPEHRGNWEAQNRGKSPSPLLSHRPGCSQPQGVWEGSAQTCMQGGLRAQDQKQTPCTVVRSPPPVPLTHWEGSRIPEGVPGMDSGCVCLVSLSPASPRVGNSLWMPVPKACPALLSWHREPHLSACCRLLMLRLRGPHGGNMTPSFWLSCPQSLGSPPPWGTSS